MAITYTCPIISSFLEITFKLKIHWRLSTIIKTSSKIVWRNAFWYVKICICWMCIQYTIHWDKTKILKKFSCETTNDTKNVLFFCSRAPTHHSFTFNLRFSNEPNYKVCLLKNVWISIFDSVSFLLKFIFLFTKIHRLFVFKTL